MVNRICIRASDPASATRVLPWPVLEAGNLAFPEGSYSISVDYRKVKDPGKSLALTHAIEGASLISRWAGEGKLQFACAVAAPISAYRALQAASGPTQTLRWNPDDIGAHPVFTPMVAARAEIEHRVDAKRDGVDHLWDGRKLRLPKGAKVAIGPTFALKSGLLGLLDFSHEEELQAGQFRIDASQEDGFKFKVRLAGDLYGYLRGGRRQETGANIMTHIVSAALGCLASKYAKDDGEEGWQSHPNLVALAALLEANAIPHWSDENFDPAQAATTLHPHRLPVEDGTQGE